MTKFLLKSIILNLGNLLRFMHSTYLKATGVEIGEGTMISLRAKLDTRRGKIIIGNRCIITYGCIILSHDASEKQRKPGKSSQGD